MNANISRETTTVVNHDEHAAGEAGQHYVNALGVRMRLWTNAERIAAGYAPVPENFISYCEPPGPRLVACSDDAL